MPQKKEVYIDVDDLMKEPKWARAIAQRKDLAEETAQVLLEARIKMGLTQNELAKKAKMTQSMIARAESGRSWMNLSFIERIAHVYKTNARIIFESMPEIVPIALQYSQTTTSLSNSNSGPSYYESIWDIDYGPTPMSVRVGEINTVSN